MEWTTEQLNKRVKAYNRIYFDNEIRLPIIVKWSRHMFNADSDTLGASLQASDIHVIRLNVKFHTASNDLMKHTLLHEMIHAWQDEHDDKFYDDWKTHEGHTEAFLRKAKEINQKAKLRYPIERYADSRVTKSLRKKSTYVYYVYFITHSKTDEKLQYPIGVFVKFLYKGEVDKLKRHGLSVKYYDNAVYSDTTEWKPDRNQSVSERHNLVTYNFIKDCTPETLIKHVLDKQSRYYIATDDDFNYSDGVEVI